MKFGRLKIRLFALLIATVISKTALTQCVGQFNSFQPGEKLNYQLSYTWGFIWIHAANVQFSVTSQKIGASSAFLLSAKASTLKGFDWFFKVRDSFQSLVIAEKFIPVWFEQNTSEGSWDVHQTYSFDPSGRKILHKGKIGSRAPVNDTVSVPACTFDVLSAIYYCRTIPFGKYKVNDKFTVNTLIDGKLYPIQFKILGKETIAGLHRKEKYSCYKLEATAIESSNFKEGQKISVWITDDDNHLPVLAEAKVVVGSVKAYLDSYEGLRNPGKSKIIAK
ncbi:MAG TPA: DUF3108 domain-containing protein [Bacteroidales bacterium]|nr:DUF3108 domain-containing protein [Bacteroidales bacterium]